MEHVFDVDGTTFAFLIVAMKDGHLRCHLERHDGVSVLAYHPWEPLAPYYDIPDAEYIPQAEDIARKWISFILDNSR